MLTSWVMVRSDQSEEASAKIKAIYIYNFTKYIEWPQNYRQGKFVIGILGSNPFLLNELNKMAGSKMVGNQKIEIKNISNITEAVQAHIVYILSEHSAQINDLVNKVNGKSILIVGDKPGMTKQGAGINFVILENKQKIELNKSNIEKYSLKVASTLIEMAIQVK